MQFLSPFINYLNVVDSTDAFCEWGSSILPCFAYGVTLLVVNDSAIKNLFCHFFFFNFVVFFTLAGGVLARIEHESINAAVGSKSQFHGRPPLGHPVHLTCFGTRVYFFVPISSLEVAILIFHGITVHGGIMVYMIEI
jgi:hypothetical protein